MNLKLQIGAFGVAALPLMDACINILEDGVEVAIFKIPSILFGLVVSWFVIQRHHWALFLSLVLLLIGVMIVGGATIYIGGTSDLYSPLKILGLLSVTGVSLISLICLGWSYREQIAEIRMVEQVVPPKSDRAGG